MKVMVFPLQNSIQSILSTTEIQDTNFIPLTAMVKSLLGFFSCLPIIHNSSHKFSKKL